MFEVKFLTEDRDFGVVLAALTQSRVFNVEWKHIINTKFNGGRVVAKIPQGDVLNMFKAWLKEKKLKHVAANDVKEFQKAHGRSPGGYSAVISLAQKAGVLKKNGKGTKSSYEVRHG